MLVSAIRRTCLAVAALLVAATHLAAQDFPSRVIKIVIPYPAGGSVDATARILAQKMSESMKSQVIVESRTGAGGNVGSDSVAKSEPDGYTLLYTAPGPLTVNQTLYHKGLPFNPERDFAPIGLFAISPIVLMVHPSVAAKNVHELITFAKANPRKLNFASAGIGTTPHLSGELLKSMANVNLQHVPYRGTGPAMQDLIAGHVQMTFDLLPTSLGHINAGKVRALANAGATRPPALPKLPTVAEQGLPGFDTSSWFGLVAPAKTPKPVVDKLVAEMKKAVESSDVSERIRKLGLEPGTAFGKDFATFMQTETTKWAKVIKESGAKAE
ncbi:MAG: tripartite tricarboxylate transporter substrate binding protein [Rhizobiales bacterium]|nr:tripartite tricarboxylate transporter substrate binding protein [Hyphomicrobiales bacterium]